uniref:MATH domain-containing protein n=1 Tax=Oryza glumipatula TaxID=40148 RepID=A0A0E0BAS2_9ORYZ
MGHRWRLNLQPNGNAAEGHASLYLLLDEDVAKPVTAQFEFSIGAENRPSFFLLHVAVVLTSQREDVHHRANADVLAQPVLADQLEPLQVVPIRRDEQMQAHGAFLLLLLHLRQRVATP